MHRAVIEHKIRLYLVYQLLMLREMPDAGRMCERDSSEHGAQRSKADSPTQTERSEVRDSPLYFLLRFKNFINLGSSK